MGYPNAVQPCGVLSGGQPQPKQDTLTSLIGDKVHAEIWEITKKAFAMTHHSHYALSADDCLHKLATWQRQRPAERLAGFSVKRMEQHWYLEAGYEKR